MHDQRPKRKPRGLSFESEPCVQRGFAVWKIAVATRLLQCPHEVEVSAGGVLRLDEALKFGCCAVRGSEHGIDLVHAGEGRRILTALATEFCCRCCGCGERARRGAADAVEPVVLSEFSYRWRVDHAAGDATLHDEIALVGKIVCFHGPRFSRWCQQNSSFEGLSDGGRAPGRVPE